MITSYFQAIALAGLCLLILGELLRTATGRSRGLLWLLRLSVWLAAAAAICWPDAAQWLAGRVGIGRGADLVSYLFILCFLATSLYFYSRHERLQQQLTEVVRYIALREAQPPDADNRVAR